MSLLSEIQKFKSYLEAEKKMSNHTVINYTTDVTQLTNYCKVNICDIKRDNITDYIAHLSNEGNSATTINRKLSSIKAFFRFLIYKDILEVNPAAIIEGVKQEHKLPEILNYNTINSLLNSIDNKRDRLIIEILYGTGIRREELTTIKVNNIDFALGCIKVLGKGNKERIVPFHPQGLQLTEEFIKSQSSNWLFPSRKCPGNHLSVRRINEIITYWVDKAGLNSFHITPHKFRHSLASHLYDGGADIKAIQDILGHASINTTNIYANTSINRNKKEYMKFHPRATI
jgi:site-specific recombinase XerD